MTLSEEVLIFLNDRAQHEGAEPPTPDGDLFKSGVLDSFGLVDFVIFLEEKEGISIPSDDIKLNNFRTLETIEQYVRSRGAKA